MELCISGNPLLRDEARLEEMTEKIRDILPTLIVLNGATLPKRISFEDDDDVTTLKSLPPSVKKLSTNDLDVNELVLRFLREYFTIYDSDNRWEPSFFSMIASRSASEVAVLFLSIVVSGIDIAYYNLP